VRVVERWYPAALSLGGGRGKAGRLTGARPPARRRRPPVRRRTRR